MAKRVPRHIRTRVEVSEAIRQLAFEVANDTFDQKWSGAGITLLTSSLSHLSSEAVYVSRLLESIERTIDQDETLITILIALSKAEPGRTLLKQQAKVTKSVALAAVFKKLAKGQRRGVNLPDVSVLRSKGSDYVPIIGIAVSMLAMVHSNFNTTAVSRHSGAGAYSNVIHLRNELEKALYTTCLQGTNPVELSGIVVSYANDLLTSVVDLTRATRDGNAQIVALYDRGVGGAAEKLGKELADWSNEIREAVTSLTSASALCLGGFSKRHEFLTDPNKVAQRSFAFSIPDGKNTEIGSLQADKLSDIAGRVTDIKVRRKGNHLITTINLTDPSSGKSTTVALSFVNGHNIGITIDAFLRCTGVFHTKSTLNKNKPALHIVQLQLASLAKSSWRAGFLSLGSTFMEIWPNGHLIKWTIGHHTTTEFEKLGTGAGEILARLTPNVTGKW